MRLDSYMAGVGLVAACAIVSVLGLLAVRRRFEPDVLKACHEVGGYLLSVVGTLYSLILGLIVVDAMSTFQQTQEKVVDEANALADIAIIARRLPEPDRSRIRGLTLRYAGLVVDAERMTMDTGRHLPEAQATALELVDAVLGVEPRSGGQANLQQAQADAALRFWNSRRERISIAQRGIPALKWLLLIVGGAMTVFFTYFFAIENLRVQAVMTAIVAILISANIYLVLMFGYPLSGDLHVDLSFFQDHIKIFGEGRMTGLGSNVETAGVGVEAIDDRRLVNLGAAGTGAGGPFGAVFDNLIGIGTVHCTNNGAFIMATPEVRCSPCPSVHPW